MLQPSTRISWSSYNSSYSIIIEVALRSFVKFVTSNHGSYINVLQGGAMLKHRAVINYKSCDNALECFLAMLVHVHA